MKVYDIVGKARPSTKFTVSSESHGNCIVADMVEAYDLYWDVKYDSVIHLEVQNFYVGDSGDIIIEAN